MSLDICAVFDKKITKRLDYSSNAASKAYWPNQVIKSALIILYDIDVVFISNKGSKAVMQMLFDARIFGRSKQILGDSLR